MDHFSAKINQVVIESTGKRKTFTRSFIANPPYDLEKRRGKLFGLIEIESDKPKVLDLINFIISEFKACYYSPDLTGEEPQDIDSIFEDSLKDINLSVVSFLESEQIILDLEKVNIILGIMSGKKIHFTHVGNLNIFLFQYLKKSQYRIINILEASKTPFSTVNPLKIFSQVIAGEIGPRDILFLTTPNILDYFSLEKIKNTIVQQDTADGAGELKKMVENVDSKSNFGFLVSEIEKMIPEQTSQQETLQEFNYQTAADNDSMKELDRTESETQKLLTPSIFPEIKKYTTVFKKTFNNYLNRLKNIAIPLPKTNFQKGFNTSKNKIGEQFNKSWKSVKNIAQPIKTKITNINIKTPGIPKSIRPVKNVFQWVVQKLKTTILNRFMILPKQKKVLLVAVFIFSLILLQNIVWTNLNNAKEQALEKFNNTVAEAEMKKNESEASLIYRDENKARLLLIEANDSLTALKPISKAQKEQVEKIKTEIEQQLERLRHITRIEEPILIANFQNLDSESDIGKFLILSNNGIYVQNHRNKSIYKINLSNRLISSVYSPNEAMENFDAGIAKNNNEIIFFNKSNKKAFSFDINSEKIKEITFNTSDDTEITDIAEYNDRFYILDKKNGQIYRYNKIINGYGNENKWLNDDRANLSDASAIIVDGTIFVLKQLGEVINLENGKIINSESVIIDPVVQNAAKIKTNPGSDYIYILDPPTKRLIVINKSGQLAAQYISDQFDDLKDFVVIESEKEIYLLNGTSVFGIPAKHLN